MLTSLWPSLLVSVVLASVYYLAAALIFPDDIRSHPDLDAHYWATKRQVIGLIFFCDLTVLLLVQLMGRTPSAWVIGLNAVYFTAIAATFFSRGRTTNLVFLVALTAIMTVGFLIP